MLEQVAKDVSKEAVGVGSNNLNARLPADIVNTDLPPPEKKKKKKKTPTIFSTFTLKIPEPPPAS